jgi:hypothetical protein
VWPGIGYTGSGRILTGYKGKLTDDEVGALEAVIRETFEHFENDNNALDHITSSEGETAQRLS